MQLKVIGTGSDGNCYTLTASNGEILVIECGVRAASIKQAIDFDLQNVVGVLLTHEHKDHSRAAMDCCDAGLDIYATRGTWDALRIEHSRAREIKVGQQFRLSGFLITSFDVKHDASEPVGFLIQHAECGTILFATDTYYIRYRFSNLNNIIIEANYCEQIINKKIGLGTSKKFLRDRILQSHFSLQNCVKLLQANDLSAVNNIVLIHLSNTNSHEARFKDEVQKATGKNVTVASKGLEIQLNKTPF